MRDEMRRNQTRTPTQYRVHENVDESFLPERPVREGDEYVVERGRKPETFFLPPNQQPMTLQAVMRPNPMNKPGNQRPPFRRPVPPEIKLRRPPPGFPKSNKGHGYPLPMPGPHSHNMQKKVPPKHRIPVNSGRPGGPMKNMPPMPHQKPSYHQHAQKHGPKPPEGPVQSVVVGKPALGSGGVAHPSQTPTLNLGQPDIIMNQVVRSQITLPGAGDSVPQHSVQQQSFLNRPGQIILGKPMDHPVPLDQQMTHTKHQNILTPPVLESHPPPQIHTKLENDRNPAQNEIKSSDFMGESVENSTFIAAVNTGFKPDSIVIESGFKPIIREPLMAAEDRITDDGDTSSNRREDTDVEEDYDESPQYINHVYPSDKMTETFEPMFIPSPPDHHLATDDRTKEIFPSNHAKEDRPHPVYVKTEEELNALFSKKNMDREVASDLVMESNKVSPQYLPPDPKLPKEHSQKLSNNEDTFTTYDGKTVSAATLTSIPEVKPANSKLFSAKLPANTEQLLKTPQFGPFKGEIPPIVGSQISTQTAKELTPTLTDSRTTRLKLVNSFEKSDDPVLDDLKAEGSEVDEVKEKPIEENMNNDDEDEEIEEEEYEEDSEDDEAIRNKRDTKTAQFEKGEVIEQTVPNRPASVDSQMDFEYSKVAVAASSRSLAHWTIYPVLLLVNLV